MPIRITRSLVVLILLLASGRAAAQEQAAAEAVLRRIRSEALDRSEMERLAQVLLDSIGPRLTGSRGAQSAHDWAVRELGRWGIAARNEQYGTWTGWRRGIVHVDLLRPRVRTLEAVLPAWSPGTNGRVEGAVVAIPEGLDSAGFRVWLAGTRGKFVMVTPPVASCRPRSDWQQWGHGDDLARVESGQVEAVRRWVNWVTYYTKRSPAHLPELFANAGAAGLLLNTWTGGWGAERIQSAPGRRLPAVHLSCEDYGLLSRLAANGQGPVIQMEIDAGFTGDAPTMNTVAEIRGRQRPQEYVVLSAHLDSWDAASGATDNGTGSVLMMEVMRILAKHHPRPRRTILLGLWGGEEQGLHGSRAFVADHPAVVRNVHLVLNQDSGTGRIEGISMEGFTEVGPYFRRWLSVIPGTFSSEIRLTDPGLPSIGNTDHASFVCAGVPAFNLSSRSWGYQAYTWHTNRDTYDKIAFADLRRNAALVAMLVYLAAEEPGLLPRTFDPEPIHPTTGVRMRRARCSPPARQAQVVDHVPHQ